jgi:hypothetical protein
LDEKGINQELVLGHPLKKIKPDNVKTNLEKERDYRGIFSYAKVDDDIYNATIIAGKHCPRLHQILVSGAIGSDVDERIINPVTTVVKKDNVLRLWSFDDFALDYMLAQQFNFEYLILVEAKKKDCKHIIRIKDVLLTTYAAVFVLERHTMDLREYLRKHRDYRKLNEILL